MMSRVDVAEAHNLPVASVSFASANATRRPNDSTRPSARTVPMSAVTGLWKATFNSTVV